MEQCRRQLKKVTNHEKYVRQIGDKLCSEEAKLFRLVKSATADEVDKFLQDHPNVGKNKINEACHSVLQEAVCRRDVTIVEVLLDYGCEPCPAVELAAKIGAHDILDVLLAELESKDNAEDDTADASYVGTRITDVILEESSDRNQDGDSGDDLQPTYYSMPFRDSPRLQGTDEVAIDQPENVFNFKKEEDTVPSSPSSTSDGTSSPSPSFVGPFNKPKQKCSPLMLYRHSPSHPPTTNVSVKQSPDSPDSKKAAFERSNSWNGRSGKARPERPRISDNMAATQIPAVRRRRKSLAALSSQQPLIMAAAADDYKGTELLIKIGCKIPEPHEPTCMCNVCKKLRRDHHDLLHDAHDRLMKYRALTSATYIILTSPDPILTSLERSDLLAELAALYPENKDEFEQLSRRSSTLAVELLTNCISEKEVVQLLMRECGLKEKGIFTYGRLQLAVGLEQKEFVTNSTCQHALYSLWLGPTKSWLKWSASRKISHVIIHLALAPLICTAFVIVTTLPSTAAKAHVSTEFTEEEPPKKRFWIRCREDPVSILTTVTTVPLNRFMYAASSYCLFLALLLYSIVQQGAEDIHPEAGLSWYHWLLFVWVAAHVYKIAQDLYTERFLSYWTSWWTLYELIMMVLFTIAACCFIAARIQVIDEKTWRVALVAEGLFAIGTTLSFMRTLQWMHLSQNLGPVIISFSRMTTVIGQLFIVFLIVVLSFSTGLYAVYQNFRLVKNDTSEEQEQDKGLFISYTRTLRALFWAIFGHGEADYADVPEGYVWHVTASNTNDSFLDDPNESFPVAVGYALWGSFHVAFVIVLLNMLIAVMTNCFQVIQDNFDVEWKFARTKLWMYYLEDHNAVPPPFNLLLPMTGLIALVATKVKTALNRKKPTFAYYSDMETVTDGRKIEMTVKVTSPENSLIKPTPDDKECKHLDDEYTKTITTLVNRFVQKRNLKEALK